MRDWVIRRLNYLIGWIVVIGIVLILATGTSLGLILNLDRQKNYSDCFEKVQDPKWCYQNIR